ncbi:M16 family metallopeptidase [Maribacter sp. X9]|uniref:M16 family metallopeptidase n=1 Tax=Maribacter sp. X9 TaxID=3402159 RepID=UPI003AF3549D
MAQSIDYSLPLPVDKSIVKGVLPNGMTYYIKSTDVVKDAASYYIIQNVGSILENENQRGLAHFLEHMAFNGTENFPGKGILNTLQKNGAVFGKDINAYTDFDETVYNINYIPTKEGLIDTCLTILKDWSNYLLLTEEEIDAERGVIKEEWRTRQSGSSRIFEKTMHASYNNSKYVERLPIGLMSVVENFEYGALRQFYHDWYRSDLQAIAIVGDVDVDQIEQKIKEKFSGIPAVDDPATRYLIDIPRNKEMGFELATDPEVATASIEFGIRHARSLEDQTVASLKRYLLESLTMEMLTSRIEERAESPNASFLYGQATYGEFTRTSNALSLYIAPKENQQKAAFKEILTELQRAVRFGFTESEVQRAIISSKNDYQNKIAQRNDVVHEWIVMHIRNDYLANETMTDVEKEYEIASQIFSELGPKDFHEAIKRLYTTENRYLTVAGVEGQDNLTEETALEIIRDVEADKSLTAYTETLEGKTLVSGVTISPGTISSTTLEETNGATTYVLSNGTTVHYKYSDKETDKVALKALSYGGTSLLEDEDLPSSSFLGDLVQLSGLGEYTASDLQKLMAGKSAQAGIDLSEITESIFGSSNSKDVETMLQLVHLHFVKPRFDRDGFQVLKNNLDNYIKRRSTLINEKMRDSLTATLYGDNNPQKPIYAQDFIEKISFDKMKEIYQERFADVSDFEFFIVGDIKKERLEPLLERYIAGIPTKKGKESFKGEGTDWVSDAIRKEIHLRMEDPKSRVNIAYKLEMPYAIKSELYTTALGDILQLRISEEVRENLGGAYSPSAYAFFEREPKSYAYVGVDFDCNPDLVDRLVAVVNGEIKKMAKGEILDKDLEKTRNNFLKEREQAKNQNAYDMRLLTSFFRYGEDLNDPNNFENIVQQMSKKDIQDIARQVLDGGKSFQVVFKPKL